MKLKQRIVIVGSAVTSTLLLLTFVTYYYVQSHQAEDSFDSAEDRLSGIRLRMSGKDALRPLSRRLKKEKSAATPNSSVYDSDRAVEVELNEVDYDPLRKIENYSRRLDSAGIRWLDSPKLTIQGGRQLLNQTFECSEEVIQKGTGAGRRRFPDLLQFLDHRQNPADSNLKRIRITLGEIHGIENIRNMSTMDAFYVAISDVDLYAEHDTNVQTLLDNMGTQPIVHVEEKEGGTQLKLIVTFQDGSQALFKPMRFNRDKETEPNHFYFVDYERHISEIAAFHLDRILGYRRCPPVVGRKLNITSEIYAVADDELIETFFISPARNICFHGTCSYYCDTSHAVCGRPDTLEGSLAAFLPPDSLSGRKSWKNPWRRSYHKRRKADFEKIPRFCDWVRERPAYRNTKRLADLIDTSILDFLIGNMDRHHYETFKIFGNDSFILHLDHGRGFGRPGLDELSILAPLYQCCFISVTTFHRLVQLQHGTFPLSGLMRCSLSRDPVSPVLLEKHLGALDRRLEVVLEVVKNCLLDHDSKDVFFVDPTE